MKLGISTTFDSKHLNDLYFLKGKDSWAISSYHWARLHIRVVYPWNFNYSDGIML